MVAGGALAGCDGPTSPAQAARDTGAAQQNASNSAAKVQQKADARIASARGDVRDEQRDLAHVDAVERQKVAETQAQRAYKVALGRCEGLSGATRQSCKDQASADYDVAKARANQSTFGVDPKP
jgi:hypothetical protein